MPNPEGGRERLGDPVPDSVPVGGGLEVTGATKPLGEPDSVGAMLEGVEI